jgi:hypothetical protein
MVKDAQQVFFFFRDFPVQIRGEVSHLIGNKVVPASQVGLGLLFEHRAGDTPFTSLPPPGLAVIFAQGTVQPPAGFVRWAACRKEGLIAPTLLPARIPH